MDEYRKYLDKEFHKMYSEEKIDTKSLAFKRFINKFASELFIPSAHAIDVAGMAVGAGLSLVAGKIDGPWSEVLNVGGKILTMHGMLGGFVKRTALPMPITRALTWTTLMSLSIMTHDFTHEAIGKVRDNIKVLDDELEKFKKSGATGSGFAGNRSGMGRDGLRTSKYGANQQGKMNIKSCVVVNGDSYLPAACPSLTPRNQFPTTKVSLGNSNDITPDHLNGLNMFNDTLYGSTTGSIDPSNLSSGELGKLVSVSKAIAKANQKIRDKIDSHDKGIQGSKTKGNGSLSANIAKIRKVLMGGESGSLTNSGPGGSGGTASPVASSKPTETLGTGNVVSGGGSGGGGSAPVAAIPSFDLDFGDEGEVAVGSDAIGAAKSAKKTEKLGDFVMKHNDINKRKDISIFKILSNRYILSYPKVLEEETSVQK
jgi:hypothetical protein